MPRILPGLYVQDRFRSAGFFLSGIKPCHIPPQAPRSGLGHPTSGSSSAGEQPRVSTGKHRHSGGNEEVETHSVCWTLCVCPQGRRRGDRLLPSMVALLGRMVMAPSATSSCCSTGLTLEPQVSEPTHRKCPT